MADKVQLNTTITADIRHALRQACQERGCAQGDLIEAALDAFLSATPPSAPALPQELLARLDTLDTTLAALPDTLDALFAPVCTYLMALEEAVKVLLERCDTLLARVPPPPPPPAPKPRIATYEQMYGPPETWADPNPLPPIKDLPPVRRGFFARVLFKEES
jgi:hypothetical protein